MQVLKDNGDDARKIGIMVASHNEDTVRFAIENMKSIGISPEDKVICFGQLLGMCDYITFPLGKFRNMMNVTWDGMMGRCGRVQSKILEYELARDSLHCKDPVQCQIVS